MSSETILDVTRAEMEQVAEAMSSIMAFLEAGDDDCQSAFQDKFQVDIIEDSFEDLRNHFRGSVEFVKMYWNNILENELYQRDIRECVNSCKRFRGVVEAFDESFSQNRELALTVFSNEWIARQYLQMVLKMRDNCQHITDFVDYNFKERVFDSDPFRGAARRFKAYFTGVSDDNLRSLVEDKIPLPRRAKWLGDRREATIFGKTLGLKCSLMNKSFIFSTRNGCCRDLNYSSDGTNLNFSAYDIAPILDSLTASGE